MKSIRFVVGVVALLGSQVMAQNSSVTLVSTGAVWKYFAQLADPGPEWTQPNLPPFIFFDDSAWLSGPAQLGYGDGDEVTVVTPGTNQNTRAVTTYFRHTFELWDENVASSNLLLRVLRDDGVIVYLNGEEIFRNNMPAGPVNYLTQASANAADENVFLSAPVPANLLLIGPNTLAAEVHQATTTSSDMSFAAELTTADRDVPAGPVVSLHVTDSSAREPGVLTVVESAQFAVRRTGSTANPLTVNLFVSGSGTRGVDYQNISNRITIPIGATQALVNIAPLMDNLVEPTETVEISVQPADCASGNSVPADCYVVGSPSFGSVTILDTPFSTNQLPNVNIVSPTNGAFFVAGGNVPVVVNAHDPDGTLSRLQVLINGQVLNTFSNPAAFTDYTFQWLTVSTGYYSITARAWDNAGASRLSPAVNVFVVPPTNPPANDGEVFIVFSPASLPGGSRLISNWVESGFYFSTPDRMGHSDANTSAGAPHNGTPYLTFGNNQKPLSFYNIAGRAFSLRSMDLAEYSTVFAVPKSVTVTGYKADNSAVVRVVQLDGVIDGRGGAADFQTFEFGPEFSQLTRVEVFPETYALDNVRVLVGDAATNSLPLRTIVNVLALDPVAGEPPHAAGTGKFSIRRSGDISSNLNVFFTVSGSASNGVDYISITNDTVIRAGAAETIINVVPLADSLIELSEPVVITLQEPVCIAIAPPPPECYLLGVSTSAVVTILDAPQTNGVLPYVSMFSPMNGARFAQGATILLGANAFSTTGVQRVDFVRTGNIPIASSFAPQPGSGWTAVWSNPPSGSHTLRAIATDLAGLRGTSAPVSIVVGSNTVPPVIPFVSVYASDPAAAETINGSVANPGRFTFVRYGATTNDLQVCFQLSGTASNGLDYFVATNCVTIPAGASNAFLDVQVIDDGLQEFTETVVLHVLPSANYQFPNPFLATVLIADNDSSPTNRPPFPRLVVIPQGTDEMTTNGCRLVLEGDGPIVCVIECSIDMLNWTPIYTNTLSGTAISFVDADVQAPRRFYRLITR